MMSGLLKFSEIQEKFVKISKKIQNIPEYYDGVKIQTLRYIRNDRVKISLPC